MMLDLTKPVADQSDAEVGATLDMQSGWQCLREIGEGGDMRAAMREAAARLSRKPGVTTASAALHDLVQTMQAIDRLYDAGRARELTDAEDRKCSALENRRGALERQLHAEVADKLGIDYVVLWHAVTPTGPVPNLKGTGT